jgi:hypothetical protein
MARNEFLYISGFGYIGGKEKCNAKSALSISLISFFLHMDNILSIVNLKEIEMKKFVVTTGAVSLFAFLLSAQAYTGQELSRDARINLKEARGIALKAYPGKIADEELEKEKGGSGLRYSFDIKRGKTAKTQEVGVDAVTGKLLENATEGPNPD